MNIKSFLGKRNKEGGLRGFTLIEFLIYGAIVTLILVALVLIAVNVMGAREKMNVMEEVGHYGKFSMNRITAYIRHAKDVDTPQPGGESDSLVLVMGTGAPIEFRRGPNDNLLIERGGETASLAASENIKFSDLNFKNLSYPDSAKTVRIEMELSFIGSEETFKRKFYTTENLLAAFEDIESVGWEWECGDTFTDERDGQEYATVQIGNQCWMKENMNYETGSSWCYDDDPSNCDNYGRLYDWDTALNACPSGWILPSDSDFQNLETELGMCASGDGCADDISWRGTNEGSKMAADDPLWEDGDLMDDPEVGESGFDALPGGLGRYDEEDNWYYDFGLERVHYWTSDSYEEDNEKAWRRVLWADYSMVNRHRSFKYNAYSVRCLRM